MAWPTTKASNQYTDSGQDRIADARAEINQNITNVNAIIDEFNIASPTDGDLLQYSSSSGKWEQVAGTSIGQSVALIEWETYPTLEGVTGSITFDETFQQTFFTSISDSNSIVTINADSASVAELELATGKYWIDAILYFQSTNISTFNWTLSTTDSAGDNKGGVTFNKTALGTAIDLSDAMYVDTTTSNFLSAVYNATKSAGTAGDGGTRIKGLLRIQKVA